MSKFESAKSILKDSERVHRENQFLKGELSQLKFAIKTLYGYLDKSAIAESGVAKTALERFEFVVNNSFPEQSGVEQK